MPATFPSARRSNDVTTLRVLAAACLCVVATPGAATVQAARTKPKCVVPGLVTFSATKARRTLAAAGCGSQVLRGAARAGVSAVVIRQSVRPGTTRRHGTVVTVRVASPTRCLKVDGAAAVFRTPDLVIFARDTPWPTPAGDVYSDGSTGEWWSCMTAVPNTKLLERIQSWDFGSGGYLHGFAASGTRLAFIKNRRRFPASDGDRPRTGR